MCYLLLCRVVLGYSLRTQQPCNHGPLGRGVAMDDGSTVDGTVFATRRHKELKALKDSEPPLHHHSLLVELGGRIHRYREFVIFHGEFVYPYVPVTLTTPLLFAIDLNLRFSVAANDNNAACTAQRVCRGIPPRAKREQYPLGGERRCICVDAAASDTERR